MQRKPTKNTRGPNAEEKRFMAWTKEQPCINCGNPSPSIVDHVYGSCFKHLKVLIGHWFVIPLCVECDSVKTIGSCRGFINKFGSLAALWLRSVDGSSFSPPIEVIMSIEDLERKGL